MTSDLTCAVGGNMASLVRDGSGRLSTCGVDLASCCFDERWNLWTSPRKVSTRSKSIYGQRALKSSIRRQKCLPRDLHRLWRRAFGDGYPRCHCSLDGRVSEPDCDADELAATCL